MFVVGYFLGLCTGLVKIGVKVWTGVLPGRIDGFAYFISKDDKS